MLAVWRSRFGYSVRLGHCPEYFMMFNEARSQKSSLSALGRRGAAMWVKRVEAKIFLRSTARRRQGWLDRRRRRGPRWLP